MVLIGVRKHLRSGSDLREFSADRVPEPQLPKVLAAIENSPRPVVAALSGSTLVAGELALACDRRIALDGGRVGFPEAGFGVIPGAGGSFGRRDCSTRTGCWTWWSRRSRYR